MLTGDAKRLGIHPSQDWRKVKLNQLQANEIRSLADALGVSDELSGEELTRAIRDKLKNEYKPSKG